MRRTSGSISRGDIRSRFTDEFRASSGPRDHDGVWRRVPRLPREAVPRLEFDAPYGKTPRRSIRRIRARARQTRTGAPRGHACVVRVEPWFRCGHRRPGGPRPRRLTSACATSPRVAARPAHSPEAQTLVQAQDRCVGGLGQQPDVLGAARSGLCDRARGDGACVASAAGLGERDDVVEIADAFEDDERRERDDGAVRRPGRRTIASRSPPTTPPRVGGAARRSGDRCRTVAIDACTRSKSSAPGSCRRRGMCRDRSSRSPTRSITTSQVSVWPSVESSARSSVVPSGSNATTWKTSAPTAPRAGSSASATSRTLRSGAAPSILA